VKGRASGPTRSAEQNLRCELGLLQLTVDGRVQPARSAFTKVRARP
jgi:hypothetical protein